MAETYMLLLRWIASHLSLVSNSQTKKSVVFWCSTSLFSIFQAKRYYDLIPPYLAHQDDWRRLLPVWVDQAPKVQTELGACGLDAVVVVCSVVVVVVAAAVFLSVGAHRTIHGVDPPPASTVPTLPGPVATRSERGLCRGREDLQLLPETHVHRCRVLS